MHNISNFASESIQNKILLVPAVAVGTFVGSRVAAAALAIGLKSSGQVVNLIGFNTLGDNLNASGNQFINFATRDIKTELKVSVKLTSAAIVGVGVATLFTAPEASLLKNMTDSIGLTIPAPVRLKGFTDSLGLTSSTTYIQNFPNSPLYKLFEKVKTDYFLEIPAVRLFRGLPAFEGNPFLTNAGKDLSNLVAGISNVGSKLFEDAQDGRYNLFAK